jgi:transcriptional regulator with XRE-family HTH domain
MAAGREGLRQRRQEQGLTQEALAFTIGVAITTYRDWERGATTPRVGFRPRLARALDLSMAETHRLLDAAAAQAPDGFEVRQWLGHYAALEQGASKLWTFEFMVPGLLQTRDYATAVEHSTDEPSTEAAVAQRVAARLARQAVLIRQPEPLDLSVVMDESALYRVAGDEPVMAAQLAHLIEVAARPTIDLRVLPLTTGAFAGAWGSFIVLYAGGSSEPYMALVLDRAGPHYLDRKHEVETHVRLFGYLRRAALSPAESVDLIHTVSKERYR